MFLQRNFNCNKNNSNSPSDTPDDKDMQEQQDDGPGQHVPPEQHVPLDQDVLPENTQSNSGRISQVNLDGSALPSSQVADPPIINPSQTDSQQKFPEAGTASNEAELTLSHSQDEDFQPIVLNKDTLPFPSILVISATPFERDPDHDTEEYIAQVEKILSRESTVEDAEVAESPQDRVETRRQTLDENMLEITAQRKTLLEEAQQVAIRKTMSEDAEYAGHSIEDFRQSLLQKITEAEPVQGNEESDYVSHEQTAVEERSKADGKILDVNVAVEDSSSVNVEIPGITIEDESHKLDTEPSHVMSSDDPSGINEEVKPRQQTGSAEFIRPPRMGLSAVSGLSVAKTITPPGSEVQGDEVYQVLKTINTVVYKDGMPMMWKKVGYSDQEELVPVPPNSMLSESERKALVPVSSTLQKKETNKAAKVTCEEFVQKKLGRAAFQALMKNPEKPADKKKIPGIDWALQQKTERFASRPHLLYTEQWKLNKMLKNQLGPGSYETKDFLQLNDEKPRSGRGICDKLGPRFDKTSLSFTPGPGAYGIRGIPQQAMEDKARRSFSTKGILDAGDRKRDLPSLSCGLAPGTYNTKSSVDECLKKMTGKLGPFNLFTPERFDPIPVGYFSFYRPPTVGPGYYKTKNFVDELLSSRCGPRGRFSKVAQYPEVPTERFLLSSLTHGSHSRNFPGPGTNDIKEFPKYVTVNPPGFLSSGSRDDKMAQSFFSGGLSLVGPGRYSVEKIKNLDIVNGHSSVFKSKSKKPSLKRSKFLQDRLQPKHLTEQAKQFSEERTRRHSIL